nr:S1 family peptidase [Bradyrhizobium sp. AUGA SZCCT0222]
MSCGEANALVGADLADRTVQRYTVVVASAKGRCSGVVLAQDIVLTAAHCVEGKSNLHIRGNTGGGYQTLAPSALSAVIETIQHPLYRATESGSPDLAIVKLEKPLPDRFLPVVVNPRSLNEGDNLIAAGYGQNSDRDTAAVLRMVLLRVSSAERDWVTLVRAGADASGARPGDSGGPVFAYRGMHSVVALMVGARPDRTRAVALSAHYRWIRETIEKLSTPYWIRNTTDKLGTP